MIFVVSARWRYFTATSRDSSSSPSLSRVGLRPSSKKCSRLTLSSFSAASRRGLGKFAISAPVILAMSSASSRTRKVSVTWLKTFGLSPRSRRVLERDLDASHGVADVDERAGLSSRTVHRERMANGRLHQEAIEHGAVVTVVVEAVDQSLVERGLGRLGTPHDSLVKIGDADLVVGAIKGEEQLVERLGEVIDGTGIGGVQDLAFDVTVGRGDLDGEVALGDRCRTGPAVTVNPHGPQVHERDVQTAFDDRAQHVVGTRHVVIHRVALRGRVAHGIRRRALLAEVDDGVGRVHPTTPRVGRTRARGRDGRSRSRYP